MEGHRRQVDSCRFSDFKLSVQKKNPPFIRFVRIAWTVVCILCCLIIGFGIHFVTKDVVKRRRRFGKNASFWCARGARTLGLKVTPVNRPHGDKNFLVLSNHLGFVDVLIINSVFPSVFVTSQEMRETPVLGLICEIGGCIFIERRSREQIPQEIKVLAEALRQGFNVCLFPEGTSGDGSGILPLKKSLILANQGTGKDILPIVINYRKVNGEVVTHKWRDHLCWYGDMTFGGAIMRLSELKSVEVDVDFLDPIQVDEHSHRREVAAVVHKAMESRFVPILYPEGMPSFDFAAYQARVKERILAAKAAKRAKTQTTPARGTEASSTVESNEELKA